MNLVVDEEMTESEQLVAFWSSYNTTQMFPLLSEFALTVHSFFDIIFPNFDTFS